MLLQPDCLIARLPGASLVLFVMLLSPVGLQNVTAQTLGDQFPAEQTWNADELAKAAVEIAYADEGEQATSYMATYGASFYEGMRLAANVRNWMLAHGGAEALSNGVVLGDIPRRWGRLLPNGHFEGSSGCYALEHKGAGIEIHVYDVGSEQGGCDLDTELGRIQVLGLAIDEFVYTFSDLLPSRR